MFDIMSLPWNHLDSIAALRKPFKESEIIQPKKRFQKNNVRGGESLQADCRWIHYSGALP